MIGRRVSAMLIGDAGQKPGNPAYEDPQISTGLLSVFSLSLIEFPHAAFMCLKTNH